MRKSFNSIFIFVSFRCTLHLKSINTKHRLKWKRNVSALTWMAFIKTMLFSTAKTERKMLQPLLSKWRLHKILLMPPTVNGTLPIIFTAISLNYVRWAFNRCWLLAYWQNQQFNVIWMTRATNSHLIWMRIFARIWLPPPFSVALMFFSVWQQRNLVIDGFTQFWFTFSESFEFMKSKSIYFFHIVER